jgi:itaconyl-CoA hydratase
VGATRATSYFEDFRIGMEFHHRRSRTLTQEENARWSLVTMNTAQAHWNQEAMKSYLDGRFDRPLVNAAVVLAISVGLTSEDISENIFADVALDAIRLTTPVFGGDTLTARSVILEVADEPATPHSGRVHYRISVSNQAGAVVATLERTVLIKRRCQWQARDADFASHWPRGQADSNVLGSAAAPLRKPSR